MKHLTPMGFLLFISLVISYNLYAYRIPKPAKITEINPATLERLNTILEELWDLSNGRYSLNILLSNPDGSLRGDVGDMVLLSTGGNYYLEINVDGSTTWRGVQLTNTP